MQRHHPNIYVSFSTTINARQKGLVSQLAIVPPTRLLVESDWHSAEQLAGRNWDVLKLVAPYVLRERAGPALDLDLDLPLKRESGEAEAEDGKGEEEEEEEEQLGEEEADLLFKAARLLQDNWQRFELNNAKRAELRQSKRGQRCRPRPEHDVNGHGHGQKLGSNGTEADEEHDADQGEGHEEEEADEEAEDDDDDDEEEEAEWECRMDFEDQWWKDVRAGALKKE